MGITRNFERLKEWREKVEREGASADLCHEGAELADGLGSDMSALLIMVKENVDEGVWERLQSDDLSTYFDAMYEAMGMENDQ